MSRSSVIPCLAYREAEQAIEWLCAVIGFERHAVYPGETKGAVAHAELRLGDGMIMLGTVNDGPFGRHIRQPQDLDSKETQAPYVVVADVDAVHARAVEAGAEIVIPLTEESYGGKGFTMRDLEGHLWSIGSYDPWEPK